ncbi:MAG: hypothetical protein K9G70_06925 [Prolixibacteraceae bacterium]|nr:hypothetical protein [Prolixibacteraceae bacterium]
MKRNPLVLVVIAMLFSVYACQDTIESPLLPSENAETILKSAEMTENDIVVETVFEEANFEFGIFAQYEGLLRKMANYRGSKNLKPGNMGNRYKNDSSITVQLDTTENTYPLTITIDYGDKTTLRNGRVISGVVSVEISAPRGTDGAVRTTTYNNCMFDSVMFDGFYVQEFNNDNDSLCTVSSNSDVLFTLPDGTVMHRTGNHTREWIPEENDSIGYAKRTITINGQTTVERSDSTTWKREIVDPLIRISDCRHPVQGVVQFSMDETFMAELDYGTGVCDDIATLTVDGEKIEIELQGKRPEAKTDKYKNNTGAGGKNNDKGQSGNNGGDR